MVLSLKRWKSRTPPGFVAGARPCTDIKTHSQNTHHAPKAGHLLGAGWSSPVARQAHNLKVTGSNPVPATTTDCQQPPNPPVRGLFAFTANRNNIPPPAAGLSD